MKLLINDNEFVDALKIVVQILNESFLLNDFYIDDKEIVHITFKKVKDE